jgi:hypothetical protein
MNLSAVILAALVASACGSAQAQQCPAGAFPTVDNWGNKVCRRFSDQSTATTEVPRNQTCPNGAYPTVDGYGNRICRSFETPNQPRTDYYDTSKGCPAGMFPTVDGYGNRVCKPL